MEFCGCPGSAMKDFGKKRESKASTGSVDNELRQWPIQLHLVSPSAPYFNDADLVIAADCVPFAYANFHADFLKGKPVVIGCPKLDDTESYADKIAQIIREGNVKSITVAHMEVPCCFGLQNIAEEAVSKSGKKLPINEVTITLQGEKQH